MERKSIAGFSLIELMVSITIIGILAAIISANFGNSRLTARNAERQTELRMLQNAISQYKQQNGRYPAMGPDTDNDDLASESESATGYIIGLTPNFISRLPSDPNRGSNPGYAYITNTNGTVYKLMALNTVEVTNVDPINYTHPLRSCDIRPDSAGNFQYCAGDDGCTLIDEVGWCSYVANIGVPEQCVMARDGGNGRFERSYAVWGGFADNGRGTPVDVALTTEVICK